MESLVSWFYTNTAKDDPVFGRRIFIIIAYSTIFSIMSFISALILLFLCRPQDAFASIAMTGLRIIPLLTLKLKQNIPLSSKLFVGVEFFLTSFFFFTTS